MDNAGWCIGMPAAESVCHTGTPLRRFTTRGWASMLFGRSNRV
jgi:hypothetical protein